MIQAISLFLIPTIIATGLAIKQPEVVEIVPEVIEETVEAEPPSIQEYAKSKVSDFASLDKLITKESNWRVGVENPNSSAKGLCQLLKYNRATYEVPENATGEQEIDGCLKYINARYGNETEAWVFWQANGWY